MGRVGRVCVQIYICVCVQIYNCVCVRACVRVRALYACVRARDHEHNALKPHS